MTERRYYPRFTVNFPLRVSLPGAPDHYFSVRATSISSVGLELACQPDFIAALLRQQQLPFACQLEFQLPDSEWVHRIPAHVATHRRISQHQYAVVLVLRHTDREQTAMLEQALAVLADAIDV